MLTPERLKALRSLRGLTQAELATVAGVSTVTIATFESGKSDLRLETLKRICNALGVKVSYSIDGTTISAD